MKSDGESVNKARALWIEAPGRARIRQSALPSPKEGEARVTTLFSAISRGTERIIFDGRVPPSEYVRMRAPMQNGDFPFPVSYGYCAVGRVDAGPPEWLGRVVFCLHPHHDRFNAPLDMLRAVPTAIPARRASLAANMETALNAVWDSGAGPGDRILIVGAGVLGLLIASIAARLPGADVVVADIAPSRAKIVGQLGAQFIEADAAQLSGLAPADVVFHTSAHAQGLSLALDGAGVEAAIVETSWYGDAAPPAPLGGSFHANRLRIISSQVGQIAPSRRARWSYARRLDKALGLLADARLDALISSEVAFDDLPAELPRILSPDAPGLATVVRYSLLP